MKTDLFDYDLPRHLIAQRPAESRENSRLLVLSRSDGSIEHRVFKDIVDYLRPHDLVIANDSRVILARLHGHKVTGGKAEILLLRQLDIAGIRWECLVRGRNLGVGKQVILDKQESDSVVATIVEIGDSGTKAVQFSTPISPLLPQLGEIPLPPYITEYDGDPERYQTVYSRIEGSAAAPTAGLHFTPRLLKQMKQLGILFDTITLHVGLDTFKPITSQHIEDHRIHTEWATLSEKTSQRIGEAQRSGSRTVAIGTTTVRTLEWAATSGQGIDPYSSGATTNTELLPFSGPVDLYITPGYRFRVVDALVTNFHLPRSTLMALVSAFIGQPHMDDVDLGRRILLNTYKEAIRLGYRFYSFGDAMLIP